MSDIKENDENICDASPVREQMKNAKRLPLDSPFSAASPSTRRPLKMSRAPQTEFGDANIEATFIADDTFVMSANNTTTDEKDIREESGGSRTDSLSRYNIGDPNMEETMRDMTMQDSDVPYKDDPVYEESEDDVTLEGIPEDSDQQRSNSPKELRSDIASPIETAVKDDLNEEKDDLKNIPIQPSTMADPNLEETAAWDMTTNVHSVSIYEKKHDNNTSLTQSTMPNTMILNEDRLEYDVNPSVVKGGNTSMEQINNFNGEVGKPYASPDEDTMMIFSHKPKISDDMDISPIVVQAQLPHVSILEGMEENSQSSALNSMSDVDGKTFSLPRLQMGVDDHSQLTRLDSSMPVDNTQYDNESNLIPSPDELEEKKEKSSLLENSSVVNVENTNSSTMTAIEDSDEVNPLPPSIHMNAETNTTTVDKTTQKMSVSEELNVANEDLEKKDELSMLKIIDDVEIEENNIRPSSRALRDLEELEAAQLESLEDKLVTVSEPIEQQNSRPSSRMSGRMLDSVKEEENDDDHDTVMRADNRSRPSSRQSQTDSDTNRPKSRISRDMSPIEDMTKTANRMDTVPAINVSLSPTPSNQRKYNLNDSEISFLMHENRIIIEEQQQVNKMPTTVEEDPIVAELQEQLTAAQKRIDDMKMEKMEIDFQLAKLEREKNDVARTVSDYEYMMAETKKNHSTQKEAMYQRVIELESIVEENQQAAEQLIAARNEVDLLKATNDDHQVLFANLQAECDAMKAQLAETGKMAAAAEEHEAERTKKLAELESLCANLEVERKKVEDDLHNGEQQIVTLSIANAQMEEKISELEKQMASAEATLISQKKNLEEITEEMKKRQAELDEVAPKMNELRVLRRAIEEKDDFIAVSSMQIDVLREKEEELTKTNNDLKNEVDSLTTLRNINRDKITELESELCEEKAKLKDMEEFHEEKTVQLEVLRKELEENQMKLKEMENVKHLLAQTEKELNSANSNLATLIEEDAARDKETKSMQEEMKSLSAFNSTLTGRVQELLERITEGEKKAVELHGNITKIEEDRKELEEKLTDALKQLKEVESTKEANETQLKVAVDNLRDAALAKDTLITSVQDKDIEISLLLSAKSKLEAWNEEMKTEIDEMKEGSKTLKIQQDEMTKDWENKEREMKARIEELEKALKTSKAEPMETDVADNRVEELVKDNERLKEDNERMGRMCDEMDELEERYLNTISKLTKENEELKKPKNAAPGLLDGLTAGVTPITPEAKSVLRSTEPIDIAMPVMENFVSAPSSLKDGFDSEDKADAEEAKENQTFTSNSPSDPSMIENMATPERTLGTSVWFGGRHNHTTLDDTTSGPRSAGRVQKKSKEDSRCAQQ